MADRSGDKVGPYRLVRRIGHGGFADVYLGEHIYLQREAAIKLLTAELDEAQIQEFLVEARTLTALNHPHIVKLLDFNIQDDTPYLVMEYAPNGSLRTRYPRGSVLQIETVVALVSQIADAVQYAHERNVIHRDIKPENMLINAQGQVLLGDFGISVVAQTTNPLENRDNDSLGTPTYMAPEQLLGKPRRASDQYALATVAYEWLCGQPPFIGDSTVAVAMQQIHNDPPLLSDLAPEIPEKVVAVIMRALKKQPEQRYPSIEEFARALHAATGLPPSALPGDNVIPLSASTTIKYQPTPQTAHSENNAETVAEHLSVAEPGALTERATLTPAHKKHQLPLNKKRLILIGGIASLIVILLIGILIQLPATFGTLQSNQQATATAQVRARETAGPRATATAAAEAYNTYVQQNGIRAGFNLHHTSVNPYEHILNGNNVKHLKERWNFASNGAISSSPIVVNDTVYVGSDDGNLYAIDTATGTEKWHFHAQDAISSSPSYVDGVLYFGSSDNGIYAVDAHTGQQRWVFHTGSNVISSPVVANNIVYVGSSDENFYAIDAQTGKELWDRQTGFLITGSPSVSNGLVFIGSWDNQLYAFDAQTGQRRWSYRAGNFIHATPLIANNMVYIGSLDNIFVALDMQTGKRKWEFSTDGTILSSAAIVDGIIYVGSGDRHLYAINAQNGQQQWSFLTGEEVTGSPFIANGIVYIGSQDDTIYALNARTGDRLWEQTTGGKITSTPTVVNGVLYVSSQDKHLYAYGLAP